MLQEIAQVVDPVTDRLHEVDRKRFPTQGRARRLFFSPGRPF